MKRQMNDTIGIDIGKDTLVIHRLPDKATLKIGNNEAGLTTLLRWLGRDEALRVVCEPTGPCHRLLEKTLVAANIAMIKVNPRQARRFAEAIGRLAKADRVDAAMLARLGATLNLQALPPKSEMLHDLRELRVARQGRVKERIALTVRQSSVDQAPAPAQHSSGGGASDRNRRCHSRSRQSGRSIIATL